MFTMIPQSKKLNLPKQLAKRSIIGKPTVVLSDAAQHQGLSLKVMQQDKELERNPTTSNTEMADQLFHVYMQVVDRQAEIYGKVPYYEYTDQQKSEHHEKIFI